MPTITFTYQTPNKINISAQVGDTVYYTPTTYIGDDYGDTHSAASGLGFVTSLKTDYITENTYVNVGTIKSIDANRLVMIVNTSLLANQLPTTSDFIFFSKDNIANMSTPLGYYASVKLKNNSITESELFNVSVDVFESSK